MNKGPEVLQYIPLHFNFYAHKFYSLHHFPGLTFFNVAFEGRRWLKLFRLQLYCMMC